MSERKNIKRNNARVGKEAFLQYGRKGNSRGANKLSFPGDSYLNNLVNKGLL